MKHTVLPKAQNELSANPLVRYWVKMNQYPPPRRSPVHLAYLRQDGGKCPTISKVQSRDQSATQRA